MSITTLTQFCEQFTTLLNEKPDLQQLIKNGREMLSQLVNKPDWFNAILSGLVLDQTFLKTQQQSVDPNEIQLYFSPDKSFSVRAFVWEPGISYPIHDHGAWGIVGAQVNPVREKKYARLDDGSEENYASIKQVSDNILYPGETTFVLPLNDGIHQMQTVGDQPSVSIHVYGKPIRKGYINFYDPDRNTLARIYPPAIYKKILAIRTLGAIPDAWAQEVLNNAINAPEPAYILEECRRAVNISKNK